MTRALLTVALLALLCGNAGAHDWYDGSCCSEHDCRQTVLREVERRDDGWFVTPAADSPVSFKPELIPFTSGKIRRSLDPLIHICIRGGTAVCLYIPDPPV
jgi:hypothetical protein